MRRFVVFTALCFFGVAALAPSAFGQSLTVRDDPNDSRAEIDIRRVYSDLAAHDVTLRIRSWERFGRHAVGTFNLRFNLDTQGDNERDFVLYVGGSSRRLLCSLVDVTVDVSVGDRRAHRPDSRDISCTMPRGWFDITKTVGFSVKYLDPNGRAQDLAPNERRYRGL